MFDKTDRRRFLRTTVATGAGLGLAMSEPLPQSVRSLQASPSPEPEANPRVRPGAVRWHTDFEAACRASRTSGKPVLHFQMMGRLDQRFC
jgi:hypothetical protein